jgi:DNA-binding transcriptional LysR family regulator
MNLAKLDLNLLLVFDALMEDSSATRAGRRLGLSQSAVSHALSRLRYALKDKLFERGPEGMRPTPRARALAGPVRQALLQIQTALDAAPFVPGESRHSFTIAVHNYATIVFLPKLATRLRRLAPNVDLRMLAADNLDTEGPLDHGQIDLVFGTFCNAPRRFETETLLEEHYVCIVGQDNPITQRQLTLERFASMSHMVVSPSGIEQEWLDQACKARGIQRRVAITVPNFLSGAMVLEDTDLIATVASRVASRFARKLGFRILKLPLSCPKIPCMMMWHRLLTNQPAHRWLRSQLVEIARAVS